MQNSANQTAKNKGIYLLPNLFTTAGLFSGFFAVISSMNGHFESAAIAIFVAMVCDGLDGRVARLTNTQSDLVLNMTVWLIWCLLVWLQPFLHIIGH